MASESQRINKRLNAFIHLVNICSDSATNFAL
jgi:hypothetical protein